MTREDIIRMAEECGIPEFENNESQADNILRFAALVAVQVEATWQNRYLKLVDLMQIREGQPNKPCCLAEREACAKVCDEHAKRNYNWASENADIYHAQAHWAGRIAAAIRARGQA